MKLEPHVPSPIPKSPMPSVGRDFSWGEDEADSLHNYTSRLPIGVPLFRQRSPFEGLYSRRYGHSSSPYAGRVSLGEQLLMSGMDPIKERYKKLLDGLQSSDESCIAQSASELASELSMAQESSISPSVLSLFVEPLVAGLKSSRPPQIIGIFSV